MDGWMGENPFVSQSDVVRWTREYNNGCRMRRLARRKNPFISQSAAVLWGQNRLSEEVVSRKGVMQGKTCDDYQVQG